MNGSGTEQEQNVKTSRAAILIPPCMIPYESRAARGGLFLSILGAISAMIW